MAVAYVSAATNDVYAIGCTVLGRSIRKFTDKQLVVLITEGVSLFLRHLLTDIYDEVVMVDMNFPHGNILPHRPELKEGFIKIYAWTLTKYSKCVFLDADTLMLQCSDELFDRPSLSAAPDIGWPDCFNSGVLVLIPSLQTFSELVEFAKKEESFDGADQGLLNSYFSDWKFNLNTRLPFVYNMVVSVSYSYAPAFFKYGHNAKIVHFLGQQKPWSAIWNTQSGRSSNTENSFTQTWIDTFNDEVFPKFPKETKTYSNENQTAASIISSTVIDSVPNRNSDCMYIEFPSSYEQFFNFHSSNPMIPHPTYSYPVYAEIGAPVHQEQPLQHFWQQWDYCPVHGSLSSTPLPDIQTPTTLPIPQTQENYAPEHHHHEQYTHTVVSNHEDCYPKNSDTNPEPYCEAMINSNDDRHNSEHHPTEQITPSADITLVSGQCVEEEQVQESEEEISERRRADWNQGKIDYMGIDSFENILKRLQLFIMGQSEEEEDDDEKLSETTTETDDTVSEKLESLDTCENEENPQEEHPPASSSSDLQSSELPGYKLGDYSGMVAWEEGRVDYGKESSNKIMERLDFFIHSTTSQTESTANVIK